jgi:redox-sensitive bicupin YhaK (pirin superfamily)
VDVVTPRHAPLAPGTEVDRYLPTRRHPTVGPWCFLDLYGPDDVADATGMAVGPHPHIGLQTVTWLLAGEVVHRDGLGSHQTIVPGQLNLMTAGGGIAHAEESPVPHPRWLHGVQLWVALPDPARAGAPGFEHHAKLPVVALGEALQATVMVGEVGGAHSPANAYSPIVGAELAVAAGPASPVPLEADFEHGLLVLSGDIELDRTPVSSGTCVYLAPGRSSASLGAAAQARVLLIGGAPFTEPLVMWWNFVARTGDEIAEARADWIEGRRFAPVDGAATPRMPVPDLPAGRLLPRRPAGDA